MKKCVNTLVMAAAMAFVTGCVSMSTYEDMERDKDREIALLQQEKAALQQQKAELQQQKAELQQQKAELDQKSAAAQQQIAALEQEKASLADSGQRTQKQYEALTQNLAQEMEKGMVQVRRYKTMLSVELAEQVFFDSGSAEVKAGGRKVLKKVGAAVKDYDTKIIRVVGYTDNVPVKKSGYKSNWDLSAARAVSVVRYLQEAGVPSERLIAVGRGENDPLASNKTAAGRQKNRRIEIMLVDRSLADELAKQNK